MRILPQAICARYGLQIGAWFAWPVRILIWIEFVIAYPIACLLDWILGHQGYTCKLILEPCCIDVVN